MAQKDVVLLYMNTSFKFLRNILAPMLYLTLGVTFSYLFLKKDFETKFDNNFVEFNNNLAEFYHNQEEFLAQRTIHRLELLININERAYKFGWNDNKTKRLFNLMLRNHLVTLTPKRISLLEEMESFNKNMYIVINKAKKIKEQNDKELK